MWLVSQEDPTDTSGIGRICLRRTLPLRVVGATLLPCAFPRVHALCAGDTCVGNNSQDRAHRRPNMQDHR